MKKLCLLLLILGLFSMNNYAEILDSKEVLINNAKSNNNESIKVEERSIEDVKDIKTTVSTKKIVSDNKGVKKIWLPWSTEIYFAKNSSRLSRLQRLKLGYVRVPRKAHIYVMGYASSRGSKKYNFRLSKSRAWVVFKYLKRKFPQNKIHFRAYGEFNPRYTNGRLKGRQGNQRVKVLLK